MSETHETYKKANREYSKARKQCCPELSEYHERMILARRMYYTEIADITNNRRRNINSKQRETKQVRERAYYNTNKVRLQKRQNESYHVLKRKCVEYLGGKCKDCELVDDCEAVYDFHHRNPNEKDFGIGSYRKRSLKNWEAIRHELDKCDLLCANCHRRRHRP